MTAWTAIIAFGSRIMIRKYFEAAKNRSTVSYCHNQN